MARYLIIGLALIVLLPLTQGMLHHARTPIYCNGNLAPVIYRPFLRGYNNNILYMGGLIWIPESASLGLVPDYESAETWSTMVSTFSRVKKYTRNFKSVYKILGRFLKTTYTGISSPRGVYVGPRFNSTPAPPSPT